MVSSIMSVVPFAIPQSVPYNAVRSNTVSVGRLATQNCAEASCDCPVHRVSSITFCPNSFTFATIGKGCNRQLHPDDGFRLGPAPNSCSGRQSWVGSSVVSVVVAAFLFWPAQQVFATLIRSTVVACVSHIGRWINTGGERQFTSDEEMRKAGYATLLDLFSWSPPSAVPFPVLITITNCGPARQHLPMGIGDPLDIANAVLFLASRDATYITGFVP